MFVSARRSLLIALSLILVVPAVHGQEEHRRGRKYKAAAPTTRIEVTVVRGSNQKPIPNAAVIFHSSFQGHDDGNLELKTNDSGRAVIDIITLGSTVDVQVLADGYATYVETFKADDPKREVLVAMLPPRAQISKYEDNQGRASDRKFGVQEPVTPATTPKIQDPKPTSHTSDPNSRAPLSPTTPAPQNPTPRQQ